ncbi:MAG: cupin domain-containing protein [Gammaproteobacteria bacterium]|nr:cupin domain-containing protein [Gammaproteobacteria bacterium]
MKDEFDDIGGHISKENDNYTVKDNYVGENLLLSSTHLFPGKQTAGHKHLLQDEIFFFTQGSGEIYLRHPDEGQGEQEELYEVNAQDIVTVQAGVFHCVHNKGKTKLKYLRVMNRP